MADDAEQHRKTRIERLPSQLRSLEELLPGQLREWEERQNDVC